MKKITIFLYIYTVKRDKKAKNNVKSSSSKYIIWRLCFTRYVYKEIIQDKIIHVFFNYNAMT